MPEENPISQKEEQESDSQSLVPCPNAYMKKLAEDRALLFDEELMSFAMGNSIVLKDTNGNRKLLKTRYDEKIDAVSAMMDAFVAYKLHRDVFD